MQAGSDAEIWVDLYHGVRMPRLEPVLTGFNANLDRIIPVTADLLRQLQHGGNPSVLESLHDRLFRSMRHCTADEWFIADTGMYRSIADIFSATGSLAIGGQAGIAAVHLLRFGVPEVICAVPGAGLQTCVLLQKAGVTPLTFDTSIGDHFDIIHLIFEYPPDLVPVAEGIVPRSNRFIVSPVHDPSSVLIPDLLLDTFLEHIASFRQTFLSGYQYLKSEYEFITAARQIRMIHGANPSMQTHVECVTVADRCVLALMLRYILPNADSIGLNEHELALLVRVMRNMDLESAESPPCTPVAAIHDAIALADATGVRRLHLHTFGTYILVLDPASSHPVASRDALLLAARAVARAAGGEENILSPEGLRAYAAVRAAFSPERDYGIFTVADRVVVIIPTCISQHINKTSGLGDILSSTAFVADRF